MKFSLVVPTYNRHALLRLTLESLRRQTFADFEVLVLDDGSTPPVRPIVDELRDERFRVRRFDENLHPADILEAALDDIRGEYFLCVEDDNGLAPGALAIAARSLNANPGIKILGTNFLHYNHSTGQGRQAHGNGFTGRLTTESAREVLWRFCSVWGIGPVCSPPMPAHFSASYYATALLKQAQKTGGRVFVKPLGDVSLLALLALVKEVHYLDLPLSYIGEHEGQITNAGNRGQRQRLRNSVWLRGFSVRHSPLRHGLSYGNVAGDCHLDVLHRLGLLNDPRSRLRLEFFQRHLRDVLSDSPWTAETRSDLLEVLPHMLTARAFREFVARRGRQAAKLLRHPATVFKNRVASVTVAQPSSTDTIPHHADCLAFADWIERRYLSEITA